MESHEYTRATIVHLRLKSDASVVYESAEWYATMRELREVPNWRYLTRGEGVKDASEVILIIGWTDNDPPSAFRSSKTLAEDIGRGANFLSSLQPLFVEMPKVSTFCCAQERMSPGALATAKGLPCPDPIREFMTIRGPRQVIEPLVKGISKSLRDYDMIRGESRADHLPHYDAFHGLADGWLEDEDADDKMPDTSGNYGCFVLVPSWSSPEARAQFIQPGIIDEELEENLRDYFGSDFWERTVVEPLRKLQADRVVSVNSWDYRKARVPQFENTLMKRQMDDY